MDSDDNSQAQIQLTFIQVIVYPLFDCFLDLFPNTLSIMDLIVDNIRQWGGYAPAPNLGRRNGDDRFKVQKASIVSNSRRSEGSRRVSLAAGTIEIPDHVEKFISKSKSRSPQRVYGHGDDDFETEEETSTGNEIDGLANMTKNLTTTAEIPEEENA
jgi:hypothetical protein